MSFGTYARKVRDPALPFRERVRALGGCVQLYGPLGYHATRSFLQEAVGPYRSDEQALLRALDLLVYSRTRWQADKRAYAERRRTAKRRGQRSPRPGDMNPNDRPLIWYGARRPAALHLLRLWSRDRLPALVTPSDPITVDIDVCVRASLASMGVLTEPERQVLALAVEQLQGRLRSERWRHASQARFQAWQLLQVARVVEYAGGPADVAALTAVRSGAP